MRILRMRYLSRRIGWRLFALALLSVVAGTATAPAAHNEEPSVFAITNARIIPVDGHTIERGTVVLRNGLIDSVGSNVSIPGDARIIDAAGLTLYPGFIDALSFVGLDEPQGRGQGSGQTRSAARSAVTIPPDVMVRPDEERGVAPFRQAAHMLTSGGSKMEAARAAGLTTALVVPRSGFFPGQSSLVNLSGIDGGRMVVKTPVAFHVNLARSGGMSGGYPGSLMGIIAFVKQTFMDAQHYQVAWNIYNANPGALRPAFSRSLEALAPAVSGQMPVVMPGNSITEIRRTLDMAAEFKLDLILAGGAEAKAIASVLRERNVPVLLTVDYPVRDRNRDPEAKEDLRTLRRRVEAPGTAAALHGAGVRFAFQSGRMDSPKDFIRNVGLAIDAGLDRDVALRALTMTAAEILGIADRLGSVERGKVANLILTTGDIFDPQTQVKHVFIDGRKFDIPKTEPAGPTETEGSRITDAAGRWILTVDSPQGMVEVTLDLQQQGNSLSGMSSSMLGTFPISDGTLSDNNFSFKLAVDSPDMGGMVIMFSGSIEGSKMTGTIDLGPMGLMDFTGSKNPSESHFAAR